MSILLVESPSSPVATKNPSSSNNVETTPPPMSNSVTNHERMVAYDSASSSNTNYFDVGEHQVVSTSTTKRYFCDLVRDLYSKIKSNEMFHYPKAANFNSNKHIKLDESNDNEHAISD